MHQYLFLFVSVLWIKIKQFNSYFRLVRWWHQCYSCIWITVSGLTQEKTKIGFRSVQGLCSYLAFEREFRLVCSIVWRQTCVIVTWKLLFSRCLSFCGGYVREVIIAGLTQNKFALHLWASLVLKYDFLFDISLTILCINAS